MSTTQQSGKSVFVPIINGIEYSIDQKKAKISSEELDFVKNNINLYFKIKDNKVTGFNNVFVLFGVVASVSNKKIKLELTLNPCDYVRGFVFHVKNSNQLNNIFDGCNELEVSENAFAVLNREDKMNTSTISVCLAQDNNKVSVYTGQTKIEEIQSTTKPIKFNNDIKDNIGPNDWKIFKYSTH
ncbi:hypothetical protein [Stygiolobus caldivivus]|uniref:Cmr7b-like BtrG-like domain-containing protein n=1 Tax=Stygiolobus caldivivus TaxID=2824673 RepID=A0A8D5U3V8_9CREN|nr:hypothetical protein [Stygiolobus caldivivus]BCU68779.1 hypothetical protein KN1_00760 [Stygiolobus caldivivus]